jgi:hypothetical protein
MQYTNTNARDARVFRRTTGNFRRRERLEVLDPLRIAKKPAPPGLSDRINLIVEHYVEKRAVNFQTAVVVDEA